MIVAAEEYARARRAVVHVPRKTRVVDLRNYLVTGQLRVFESRSPGTLHELVLRSSSNKYTIVFAFDGYEMRRSWREMNAVSQYLEAVDAFEENGGYVLHIKNFSWVESAHLDVVVEEPILFANIFAKFDELAE